MSGKTSRLPHSPWSSVKLGATLRILVLFITRSTRQLDMVPEVYPDHQYTIELPQRCRRPAKSLGVIRDRRLKILHKVVSE